MEVARKLLIIYFNNVQCLKKVANFGNLIYHSKKLNYAYLYVDEKKIKASMENIKQIQGVQKVEISLTEMEEYSFKI